jgi:TRAP-type C4-dicarboxylate transport system substrate-binding protein
MKTLRIATACALLASFGLAAAAQARPAHHRVCHTTWEHHHKVTRCR